MIVLSIVEFAAKRRGDQDSLEKDLYPFVAQAMKNWPADGWYNELLAVVARTYLSTFHTEGGRGEPKPSAADFTSEVRDTLDKTDQPDSNTVDRVSVWLATAILNAGTQAAADTDEEFLVMEWVTMHDKDVRPEHKVTEGQQRPIGEPYDVDGVPMRYPGDPKAPIALWINCRCTLAPVLGTEAASQQSQSTGSPEGIAMTSTDTEPQAEPERIDLDMPTPWHGVLAPEGVWSGDGRRFAEGSLQFRDLPIPLTWQKATESGHDGSVVIGKISTIERVGNLMNATGTFLATPEADEVVGLISEFGRFGVSVDADSAEMDFDEEAEGKVTFTAARIASASVVTIPAFSEAYITLGLPDEGQDAGPDVCNPDSPDYDEEACAAKQAAADAVATFVSDKPWSDFGQGDYTDEQWKSACIMHVCDGMEKSCHKLPIKEPGGALNRNAVHAAASRFNQVQGPAEAKASAKRSLRGAYKQIGEQPPDALKASALMDVFKRGPGWVTHPEATRRIHAYWTKKGQPGYAKIGWGTSGDFNRCRIEVGEEIGENSPEKLRFINQICAQWHHDALGIWPGRPVAADTIPFENQTTGAALSLVAATTSPVKAAWFVDPHLDGPTPLTVTDEGRVYGHLALWGTCHTGFDGVCIMPPHSANDYAFFRTGVVHADDGNQVPVGQITMGGGHAKPGLRWRPALAHYDSTSSVVADITCGEDDHGIWVAGQTRDLTDEQMRELRAAPLSGDWRTINSENLDLIAALAVNSPGFPVPRVGVSEGNQVSLVAAAVVAEPEEDTPARVLERLGFDPEVFGEAVVAALSRQEQRRERLAALRARVGGDDI